MNWFKAWLALSLRSQIFMVNDGNDDKADLIDPAKYGLENTVNVYFPSLDPRAIPDDAVAGWFVKPTSARNTVSQVKDGGGGDSGACEANKEDCGILGVGKLTGDDTVFILLHGNAKVCTLYASDVKSLLFVVAASMQIRWLYFSEQNRGASHRLAEYKVWQRLGYYVLTIDYRGYGDTRMNGTIGETTLVEDSKAAIKLVRHAQVGLPPPPDPNSD